MKENVGRKLFYGLNSLQHRGKKVAGLQLTPEKTLFAAGEQVLLWMPSQKI